MVMLDKVYTPHTLRGFEMSSMPFDKHRNNAFATVPFRTIAHVYDADDPSVEEKRELSDRAEKQIFREVLNVPTGYPDSLYKHLDIRLPAPELTPEREAAIIAAVRAHFHNRALDFLRDRKLTMRVGLREIRLTLAVCIPSFIGIAICSQFKGSPISEVIENVLVIFCWVTIWQPFQSLVFDRWTQSETAKVYQKIAEMEISVTAG
ncbi:MAG: hypothetical protein NTZ37_09140 [Methanoregula sp.]|jgi:hypothetical protein|nr:hypothetical protein [Methanoregula sp.]